MSKKIAIFPIDADNAYILDNADKFVGYELLYGILPKGWGFKQYEIKKTNLLCSEDEFKNPSIYGNVDMLLLCDSKFITDYTVYEHMIYFAKKEGLEIGYLNNINLQVKKYLDESNTCINFDNVLIEDHNYTEIKDLVKPVIAIIGFGENCEKMHIQLSLYDFFKNQNYNPCLITSNIWGALMGVHTLPDFIFDNKMGFTQTVKSFGNYIKDLEQKENPDVIILGVPGAPAQLNRLLDYDYGYIPFLVTNAVKPDIGILSLYCGDYKEESFNELKKIYYYRFGIKCNYFHLSRKVSNYNIEQKKMEYYTIDKGFVIENFMNSINCVPIFQVNDTVSKGKVYNKILDELRNNIEVM